MSNKPRNHRVGASFDRLSPATLSSYLAELEARREKAPVHSRERRMIAYLIRCYLGAYKDKVEGK